jgi:ribosomal protein L21E
MNRFSPGDRVRIDIPNKDDPDHHYHGQHGEVTQLLEDDAGETTADTRDSHIYRIQLNDGEEIDVRWRDLRPPLD